MANAINENDRVVVDRRASPVSMSSIRGHARQLPTTARRCAEGAPRYSRSKRDVDLHGRAERWTQPIRSAFGGGFVIVA